MIRDLDIRKLLTGDVNRIRYVTRYSTSLVIHRENVAEHSYYVAQYAMFICRWVRMNDPNTFVMDDRVELQVLRRCIIHDLDESRTGDFQRPFKYSRPDMKALMDEAAREEFTSAIAQIFPEDGAYVLSLTDEWENAKDGTTAGAIVAFADYLSVISHLYAEVSCANLSVMQHYESLMEYTDKFNAPRYEFIRPLVQQTQDIFSQMMATAKERLPEIR
jgi:5'-deoxynucleotidase YfbR-like HD superfamily hydrolase